MDRQLLERLIGAGVLVVALVIVVPAILDGDSGDDADSKMAVPATGNEPRRTHTIRLDQSTERPPVAREVSEPAKPIATPKSAPVPTAAAESTADAKSTPVVAEKPKPVVEPKPQPVAVTKPKVPDPPPVKSTPVPTEGWVVQLGSFSSKENAQRLADEVSARGFSAFMQLLDNSGTKLYRVRVGPRETREQATELAGRLAKVGYTGQVTRQLPDA